MQEFLNIRIAKLEKRMIVSQEKYIYMSKITHSECYPRNSVAFKPAKEQGLKSNAGKGESHGDSRTSTKEGNPGGRRPLPAEVFYKPGTSLIYVTDRGHRGKPTFSVPSKSCPS